MKREIKFRAKTVNGSRWVYGDLITKPIHNDCVILENGVISHSVIPETVGQFTGLQDKNNVEIWENDIVEGRHNKPTIIMYSHIIIYPFDYGSLDEATYTPDMCVVIGNIHDNPTLIAKNPDNKIEK